MNKKYIQFNNRIILVNGATIKLNSTKRIFNYKLNNVIYKDILNNENNLKILTENRETKVSAFYKKYNLLEDE